jgi:AcrR family transcriptional regulator
MAKNNDLDEMIEIQADNHRLITVGVLIERVRSLTGQRCTPQMINNYEKQGLLQHSAKTKGGFRLFSAKDIQTTICIKAWQSQGLSLNDIKIKLPESPDKLDIYADALILPDDRRMQILKASSRVFPRKGYEATTIQDIAGEANISSSMIYQYFIDKEELFLAFTERMSFSNILFNIDKSLEIKEYPDLQDVRSTLIELGRQFTSDHASNVDFIRLLYSVAKKYPHIGQDYLRRFVGPMDGLLENYFNHLIKLGIFRPINTKLAVKIYSGIWTSIFGLRDMFYGKGIIYIPEEMEFGEMVDIFLAGMVNRQDKK